MDANPNDQILDGKKFAEIYTFHHIPYYYPSRDLYSDNVQHLRQNVVVILINKFINERIISSTSARDDEDEEDELDDEDLDLRDFLIFLAVISIWTC